jgi:hypothetical protein
MQIISAIVDWLSISQINGETEKKTTAIQTIPKANETQLAVAGRKRCQEIVSATCVIDSQTLWDTAQELLQTCANRNFAGV